MNFNSKIESLIQSNHTDYDTIAAKPYVISKGPYHLVFPPVTFMEIVDFLTDTYALLTKWGEFFDNLDLLNYSQINDPEELSKYVEKLRLYNLGTLKKNTLKDIGKFVQKWGKVYNSKGKEIKFKKKLVKLMTLDELIVSLCALIIFNEEVPKKKVQGALKNLRKTAGLDTFSGTSPNVASKFPKWADIPLNK